MKMNRYDWDDDRSYTSHCAKVKEMEAEIDEIRQVKELQKLEKNDSARTLLHDWP